MKEKPFVTNALLWAAAIIAASAAGMGSFFSVVLLPALAGAALLLTWPETKPAECDR